MELKPTKVYYWFAEFQDGFVIKQFAENGDEIQQKDFCDKSICTGIDAEGKLYYKPNENYFTELEKSHGRVVKIGWMPFSQDLANKVLKKNNTVSIMVQKDVPILIKEVPENCYGFIMQVNHIEVPMSPKCPICNSTLEPKNQQPWCPKCCEIQFPEGIRAKVGKLFIRIIPRNGPLEEMNNYEINLKEIVKLA